jgi:F0F1-type ATP synthase assembly protein I
MKRVSTVAQQDTTGVDARPDDNGPDIRVGISQRTIASYPWYADATKAVDRLRGEDFPIDRAAVAGRGLQPVEQATGRVSMRSAAVRAAISGAIVGALIGWLLGLFTLVTPRIGGAWVIVVAAVLGAVLAAAVALIGYKATGGRRQVSALRAVRAEHYDVLVDADLADRAATLLRRAASRVRPLRRSAPDL